MFRYRIVQGLADFIESYGGKGKDPLMRSIWFGIKGQVPVILKALDDNEEAVAEIEKKLKAVLGVEEPPKPPEPEPEPTPELEPELTPEQVIEIGLGQKRLSSYGEPPSELRMKDELEPEPELEPVEKKPGRRKKQEEAVAEVEIAIEPLEE